MDVILVKNAINGVNLVKICHFGETVQNQGILGAKITPYFKIWGSGQKNFPKGFEKLFQSLCSVIKFFGLLKISVLMMYNISTFVKKFRPTYGSDAKLVLRNIAQYLELPKGAKVASIGFEI